MYRGADGTLSFPRAMVVCTCGGPCSPSSGLDDDSGCPHQKLRICSTFHLVLIVHSTHNGESNTDTDSDSGCRIYTHCPADYHWPLKSCKSQQLPKFLAF